MNIPTTTRSALPLSIPTAGAGDPARPSLLVTSPPPPSQTLKTPTIRTRLSKLCQDGKPHLARQLFDTIPRPSTALWNTIIIGFVCNGMPLDALLFYSRMKSAAPLTPCDSYTYSSVLKACAEVGNLEVGKALHCHLVRSLEYPSRVVCNSLLNMYSACLSRAAGEAELAKSDLVRRVFDSAKRRDVVSWNTLISWYAKTGRCVEAVRHFRIMIRTGMSPSPVTFVNVFPAVPSVGDCGLADALYGMLVRLGGAYVNDLFVVSSVILAYSELGRFEAARKVFDNCSSKNTEVWNTMIGGYVQKDCFFEAVDLFLEAFKSERAVADEVTYLHALTTVSQIQRLDLAHQLHAFVIKNFVTIPLLILNAIIVMYSRCNSVYSSYKVFQSMVERDVISWNTMISSFVNNGHDNEGLMLVYEMQKQKCKVDSVTITALLSAASNLRNGEIGKQTHAYLLRNSIVFEGIDGYLIDMYAKSGLVEAAKRVFESCVASKRDQATWNSLIAGYTQHGLIEEALSTFAQMMEQNVKPTAVTFASILPSFSKWGSISLGKQLHGVSIRHRLDQNIFVSTALVDMYSKTGSITYADRVFSSSGEKNSITYTTMILGYGHHGMGDRALSLFRSMEKVGIEPDSITFIAVLSACSYAGLVDEGLQIFNSMERDFKVQPSTPHFCCVADMLGRAGRVVEAYNFVQQLGEEGNVLEVWGSLLGACRTHGHTKLSEEISKKLLELEGGQNLAGYRVLLSNIYAEEGDWENVDHLRKEMRERGLRKEVGRSWIHVDGSVSHFVSKDQEHPQSVQIYEMLEALTKEMKGIRNLSTDINLPIMIQSSV